MIWKEDEWFAIDPTDYASLVRLMDKHEEYDSVLFGVNEYGETTRIGVFADRIAVRTFQKNGWSRMNIYWKDGNAEEIYEERWTNN